MNTCIIPMRVAKYFGLQDNIAKNLMLSNLFMLFLISIYVNFFQQLLDAGWAVCLFQKFLHIPCVGCGMSRSLQSLLGGNLIESMRFHPSGIIFFSSILLQSFLQAAVAKHWVSELAVKKPAMFLNTMLIALSICVWIQRLVGNLGFLEKI